MQNVFRHGVFEHAVRAGGWGAGGVVTRRAQVGGPAAFRRRTKVKPRDQLLSCRKSTITSRCAGAGDAGRAKTAISTPGSRETSRPGRRRGEIANNCWRPLNYSFH